MSYQVKLDSGFSFHTPNPDLLRQQHGLAPSTRQNVFDFSDLPNNRVASIDVAEPSFSLNQTLVDGNGVGDEDPGKELVDQSDIEILNSADPEGNVTSDSFNIGVLDDVKARAAAVFGVLDQGNELVSNPLGGLVENTFENLVTTKIASTQAFDFRGSIPGGLSGGEGTKFAANDFSHPTQSRFNNFYRSMAS